MQGNNNMPSSDNSSELVHEKAFLSKADADKYFARLQTELPWGNTLGYPVVQPH